MVFWLKIAQVSVAIILMVAILMQNRGAGVGGILGGSGGVYLTKRGLEKKLHIFTIIIAVIFILISLATFWIKA